MSNVSRSSLAAAITLALGVGHAQATTFNVTSTGDSGEGTLRQALIDAAGDSNIPHTIDLSAIAGQTINTTSRIDFSAVGQDMDLTIEGSDVTVASDGNEGVFAFYSGGGKDPGYGYALDVTISDLTISGGASLQPGGGILIESANKYGGSSLTLDNVTVTGNSAPYGGGVASYGAGLTVIDSTITNNSGSLGGGIFNVSAYMTVSGSSIQYNYATPAQVNPEGRHFEMGEHLAGRGSSNGVAAGIFSFTYGSNSVTDSSISGNVSQGDLGGGLFGSKYGEVSIERSSLSDNSSEYYAGGMYAYSEYGSVYVRSTTISGNTSGTFGGASVASYEGAVVIENTTVSGNSANQGFGGLLAASYYASAEINFSTIVGNSVNEGVGGVVMFSGDGGQRGLTFDPSANGSIISGNLANGLPSDLDSELSLVQPEMQSRLSGLLGRNGESRGIGGGGNINVNYTLLGASSPSLTLDITSQNLLGQDPVLGPLANNGGSTLTHQPGATSPALNVVPLGTLGCGTSITEDQRGEGRPQDTACTLGSVDTQGEPAHPALPVPTGNRIGMFLMAGLLGLAGLIGMRRRRKPLA